MSKTQDVRNQMPGGQNKRNTSQIKKVVRHHSATASGDAQSFANYHTGSLGWKTSGYHEVILRDGTVQICYNPDVVTNGVGNHNSYTYHICVVGNGSFTEEQEKAFTERALFNMNRFGLVVSDVLGHKEFSGHQTNVCPGIDMHKVRAELSKGGNDKVSKSVSDWAEEAYKWVMEQKISDGSRPKDNVTREELWTMLWRAAGSPKIK